MRWHLSDSELLCCDDSASLTRLSADVIWGHCSGNPILGLPALSTIGIRCSPKYLDPVVELVETSDGPFGMLVLTVSTRPNSSTRLGNSHESDHVVINGVWSPLYSSTINEITTCLATLHLELGRPLSAREYLVCVRDLINRYWFVQKCEYSAFDWSAQHQVPIRETPDYFVAQLTDYQSSSCEWLSMMRRNNIGVILGDAMGLGKTIQVIKTICDLLAENQDAKTLVVCPSALVENWTREIEKFTRGLKYMIHVGSQRSRNYRDYTSSIMLTTYDVVRMDIGVLSLIQWDLVVLDEAQFIKNPGSQRTRAIKKLPRNSSIAVTGTPFENHVTDIWSLFDFCIPEFLGTESQFRSTYFDNEESAKKLGKLIAPLLLRRTLKDIPNDLPPIITLPMPIALNEQEAVEYERRKEEYMQAGSALGAIGNLISDLAAPETSRRHLSKLKYEYFDSVMDEVIESGEKIIVFAERKATIAELERLYRHRIPCLTLNGETPMAIRQQEIDRFSAITDAAMLVCNPTVGGAGLNITAANHIFHFSMQWNPAKFDQADARAHRRGQQKTVISHYPFYASTIEEYMWEKVAIKRELASEIVVGNKAESTANELYVALSYNPMISRG